MLMPNWRAAPRDNRNGVQALYIALILFMILQVLTTGWHLDRIDARRNFVDEKGAADRITWTNNLAKLANEAPKLPPPLSLTSNRRDIRRIPSRAEQKDHDGDGKKEVSAISHAVDDDDYHDYGDEDEGPVARIERAIVAPVHLIGREENLRTGSILKPTDRFDHQSFPKNSMVLITTMSQDIYQGYITNIPLSENERKTAQQSLRVANAINPIELNHDRVVFYGYGGPVKSREERWGIIHDNVTIKDANVVGTSIAVGGDFTELVSSPSIRLMVFYGSAVWLPGQLEREIAEGFWNVSDTPISSFDEIVKICTS